MTNAETKYELMAIIDSGIGQANVTKRIESIKKQISKHGEIFFEDVWGERDLAYKMKGHQKGHYAVIGFTFESGELPELEMTLRLEPEVIRHIIVKVPFKYQPKSLDAMKAAHAAAKEEAAAAAEAKVKKD